MAELNEREQEALESYRRYVAQRERCVAGGGLVHHRRLVHR